MNATQSSLFRVIFNGNGYKDVAVAIVELHSPAQVWPETLQQRLEFVFTIAQNDRPGYGTVGWLRARLASATIWPSSKFGNVRSMAVGDRIEVLNGDYTATFVLYNRGFRQVMTDWSATPEWAKRAVV